MEKASIFSENTQITMNTEQVEIHRCRGYSGEVSSENKQHGIGQWRKNNPCYKVAQNLAESCSCYSALCMIEFA
jgi:hypothetical protein